MAATLLSRFSSVLWTLDPKKRIRSRQWSLSLALYVACSCVLATLSAMGAVPLASLVLWLAFILAGLAAFYALIRSGWTERLPDPALTEPQIAFGLLVVLIGSG